MESPPLRLEYVQASTLSGHPLNWRVATKEGLAAIRGSIGETGWAGALLFNERTGRLLDGHKRQRVAGADFVPVLIGSWDEITERKILLYHDQVGNFSGHDADAFAQLLATDGLELNTPELEGLLDSMAGELGLWADSPESPDDTEPEAPEDTDAEALDKPGRGDVPDGLWPSDNDYGIPTLLLTRQGGPLDFPLTVWGSIGRYRMMRGTWCFYTDDRRFEGLWTNPAAIFNSQAVAAFEPNFSTHGQIPAAVTIYRTYQKRWIARFWQEHGLRVWVDVNVDSSARGINFAGVPKGWQAYSSRSHGNNPSILLEEWTACVEHSGREDLHFCVYGGGQAVQALARERGWIWVPEHSQSVRNKGVNVA